MHEGKMHTGCRIIRSTEGVIRHAQDDVPPQADPSVLGLEQTQ